MTWEPLPYYSIFLVLLISVLRTIVLVKPLHHIPSRAVKVIMCAYAAFLIVRFWIGALLFGSYKYEYSSAYSWIHIHNVAYKWTDLYLSMALIALPILPILASTGITAYFILRRTLQRSVSRVKRHAAVTVLIFTCVYIVCNIPVLTTIVWFSILTFTSWTHDIFDPSRASVFTNYYIWPVTFVILVQFNAGLNPLIYLFRMVEFRRSVSVRDGARGVSVRFRAGSEARPSRVSIDVHDTIVFSNQFISQLPQMKGIQE